MKVFQYGKDGKLLREERALKLFIDRDDDGLRLGTVCPAHFRFVDIEFASLYEARDFALTLLAETEKAMSLQTGEHTPIVRRVNGEVQDA